MRLILAALIAALPVVATAATYNELLTEFDQVRTEIRNLPFVKASAYAIAINEYCFPAKPFATDELYKAARRQVIYGEMIENGDMHDKAIERAGQHLMTNTAACEPATAYVTETIEAFPKRKAELDALVKRYVDIGVAISNSPERIERCAEALRNNDEAGKASCKTGVE